MSNERWQQRVMLATAAGNCPRYARQSGDKSRHPFGKLRTWNDSLAMVSREACTTKWRAATPRGRQSISRSSSFCSGGSCASSSAGGRLRILLSAGAEPSGSCTRQGTDCHECTCDARLQLAAAVAREQAHRIASLALYCKVPGRRRSWSTPPAARPGTVHTHAPIRCSPICGAGSMLGPS